MASAEQQLVTVTDQLALLLRIMLEDQVVDDRFIKALGLQDSRLPNYISEVIQFFFESSNSMLDTIRGLLLVPEVDFVRIAHLGDDLKQGAAPLGAVLVVSHCDVLLETCRKHEKQECAAATHAALVAPFESRARACLHLQSTMRYLIDRNTGLRT